MIIVGLTGGIGSGKSTVASMFIDLGIPVFVADKEAKLLMTHDDALKSKIKAHFGKLAYTDTGELNRSHLANKVFHNPSDLAFINSVVHPAVRLAFEQWVQQQKTAYLIQESAILFEHGLYKNLDRIITVIAPEEIRITRVISRDRISREEVIARMNAQWKDAQRIPLSHYIIENLSRDATRQQVQKIHLILSELAS